jgi:hypothetical protein
MKTKKLFFYLLACTLGGCLPVLSLHPLYTDKNLTFDEKLIGTWVDANEATWQFSDANKPEKAYELIFTDTGGRKGSCVAHLVKLDNKLFLDVYPNDIPLNLDDPNTTQWLYNNFLLIPAHTFIKVNGIEPQLKLQLTDDEEFQKLLMEDHNVVEYASIEGKLVLTASTKELQAFVLKYADDSRLFTKESILTRKTAKGSQKPVKPEPNEPNSIDPSKNRRIKV